MTDPKSVLHSYLRDGREALVWKIEGLGEYNVRRPMTATGTNLLGILKHVASVEAGYLGDCFGRPFEQTFPWCAEGAEDNADMWATADESLAGILDLYHRVWRHSDATIEELDLDAPGTVPWWPQQRRDVTLQQILVHMIAETHRHAGHMDIVRELIDEQAGWKDSDPSLPSMDWPSYRSRLQDTADLFRE